MRQVYQDNWLEESLQDDFNYGVRANTIDAFSNSSVDGSLNSDLYQEQNTCQKLSTENSAGNAVGINAFGIHSSIPDLHYAEDYYSLASEVNESDSPSLDSGFTESVSGFDSIENSFGVRSSLDFGYSAGCNSSLDYGGSEYSLDSSAIPSTVPSFEEEFEIEIEEPESVHESEQRSFKGVVEQAVEGGVATAATGILSAYVSPVVASAVVNTGIAAGKKICFGIANRRAQKKIVSGREDSDTTVTASESKRSSELKKKLKEKGTEFGKEVGKEVARQVCFGIENHRKQKASKSTSRTPRFVADSSLDYEPGDGVGLQDLLDSVDVAELVRVVGNGLHKKVPAR